MQVHHSTHQDAHNPNTLFWFDFGGPGRAQPILVADTHMTESAAKQASDCLKKGNYQGAAKALLSNGYGAWLATDFQGFAGNQETELAQFLGSFQYPPVAVFLPSKRLNRNHRPIDAPIRPNQNTAETPATALSNDR